MSADVKPATKEQRVVWLRAEENRQCFAGAVDSRLLAMEAALQTVESERDEWREAARINRAFPEGMCYLVGSSLVHKDYRDVDVRLILPDEEYDRMFGAGDWANPLWSLMCTSLSLWLGQQTDLPVDFQIQRRTQANELHDGQRNALGIFLDYPGERPSDVSDVRDKP